MDRAKPKIVIASSGLGHVARGIETWATDLHLALAEQGADVTLCKGGGSSGSASERLIPCWQRGARRTQRIVSRLPHRAIWRLGIGSAYGLEQTTFAFGLIRYLRRTGADLLHVQDPRVALIIQWARRLGLLRAKTILGHGTNESLAFQEKFTYLQHLAPWHAAQAKAGGIWKPTWTAIPNFIDTRVFHPGRCDALRDELGIPRDGLIVLSAAAIKRDHKRMDYLIGEFERLLAENRSVPVWLVIAGGREPETEELAAWGNEVLGNRVRFLIAFPRQRMPELYRAADIFALCSLREMMPIALVEATASGLPCLVNRHPVLEWIVGPGGEAIDLAAPGALASALGRMLHDATARRALGAQARAHCLWHFSRERVIAQILAYYDIVLNRAADRSETVHTTSALSTLTKSPSGVFLGN